MNPNHLATLSAFLDDEGVSPEALADALASPGGRDALLDFVLLRAALREEPVPTARMRTVLANATSTGRGFPRWLAAAALILVVFALVRFWPRDGADGAPRPPAVTREVPFAEGVDWFRS